MSWSRICWKLVAGVLGVLLLCFAGYNYVRCYCCAPIHLTISGGDVCPMRTEMACHMTSAVHDSGVTLDVVPATNSDAICAAVNEHLLDLGLVLGGFPQGIHDNVRQVAMLGVEPLHLLVRGKLLTSSEPSLDLLRGRRVDLGERGTNGAMLSEDLLRFAGMQPNTVDGAGDYQPLYSKVTALFSQLDALRHASPIERPAIEEQLPDAVFIVDGLPSQLVDELVKVGGYGLVPLPYATALHLDSRRDHAQEGRRLESGRVEAVTIPAFSYGVRPPSPSRDCQTFGLRLLLIAHKDVSPTALLRLLRAFDDGIADKYHIELNSSNVNNEFPIHSGAEQFAKGRRPMVLGEFLEPMTNLFSVLGATCAGCFAIWSFFRGLLSINPDTHLRQVDRIERLLLGSEIDESAPKLPAEFVAYLETRLAEVKQAAIEDYTQGRMEGDEALVGILTLIADTRHLLVQRRKLIGACEPATLARPNRLPQAA